MDITVLGGGVIGLTTALKLQAEGHRVTLRTWKVHPDITSERAAAFWSPYRIGEDERTFSWIAETYRELEKISRIPGSGVSMIPLRKYLRDGEDTTDRWWLRAVPDEKYSPLTDLPAGFAAGWTVAVPLMETPVYLPYLMKRLSSAGVPIHTGQQLRSLDEVEGTLVNCTGLGSRGLCNDPGVIPIRGQIALLSPQTVGAIVVDADMPTYIVPRADGCVVGGTYERGQEQETTDPATIAAILERAPGLAPGLDTTRVLRTYAGLRPYRSSVRLERDGRVIHHYGHGGAGFTLSWGAAAEVARLVR